MLRCCRFRGWMFGVKPRAENLYGWMPTLVLREAAPVEKETANHYVRRSSGFRSHWLSQYHHSPELAGEGDAQPAA